MKTKKLFLLFTICSLLFSSCKSNRISLKETFKAYAADDGTIFFVAIGQKDCPNCYIGLFQITSFFEKNTDLINNMVYVFDEENVDRYNYFKENYLKIDLLNDNKLLNLDVFNAINKKCDYKGRSLYGWYNVKTELCQCATIRKTKTIEEVEGNFFYF